MAGLQKVVLSLKHGHIPPNLHFNTPNHDQLAANTNKSGGHAHRLLLTPNLKWSPPGSPLGINDINAHMILSNLSETQQEWLNDYMPDVHGIAFGYVVGKIASQLVCHAAELLNADLSGMSLQSWRATQFRRADYGARYALVSSTSCKPNWANTAKTQQPVGAQRN